MDPIVVALLGPDPLARCTEPGCGEPDPCGECEERRWLADAGPLDLRGAAFHARRVAERDPALDARGRSVVRDIAAIYDAVARAAERR